MSIRALGNPSVRYNAVWDKTGKGAVDPAPLGLIEASGGFTYAYTGYKSHTFHQPGSFVVTEPGTADIMVVGGGGGGATYAWGGGGGSGAGAGGVAIIPGVSLDAGTYAITVGDGGAGGTGGSLSPTDSTGSQDGNDGADSTFAFSPTITYTALGGGKGINRKLHNPADPLFSPPPAGPGNPGGCGGGAGGGAGGTINWDGGTATQPTANPGIPGVVNHGYAGGAYTSPPSSDTAGGGGGAGAVGQPGNDGGNGGDGLQNDYQTGTNIYYAGGGAGNVGPTTRATGGQGGGGKGGTQNPTQHGGWPGTPHLGGGGGGGGGGPTAYQAKSAGTGGSGIVVVRYAASGTATNVTATGGDATFTYNSKKIHAFTTSGALAVTAGANTTLEYVIIGGGGSGGSSGDNSYGAGGGGAGQIVTGSIAIPPAGWAPVSLSVTVGDGGAQVCPQNSAGNVGDNSVIAFPAPDGGSVTAYGGGGGSGNGPFDSGTPATPGVNYPSPTRPTVGSGSGGGQGYNFGTVADGGPQGSGAHPGGAENLTGTNKAYGAAGGGGAGSRGQPATPSPGAAPDPWIGGAGGYGVKLPATFCDPTNTYGAAGHNGDPAFWVCGGGAGGLFGGQTQAAKGGAGGDSGGPYSGGGDGGPPASPYDGGAGTANTGGGGGGAGSANPAPTSGCCGGAGGSGLVLIAYPT